MAIYIGVQKLFSKENSHFYIIKTNDFDGIEAYMTLDSNNKSIKFYKTNAFDQCIKTINLNEPDKVIGELPGIPQMALNLIVLKGLKALKKNDFPEVLDYCA